MALQVFYLFILRMESFERFQSGWGLFENIFLPISFRIQKMNQRTFSNILIRFFFVDFHRACLYLYDPTESFEIYQEKICFSIRSTVNYPVDEKFSLLLLTMAQNCSKSSIPLFFGLDRQSLNINSESAKQQQIELRWFHISKKWNSAFLLAMISWVGTADPAALDNSLLLWT